MADEQVTDSSVRADLGAAFDGATGADTSVVSGDAGAGSASSTTQTGAPPAAAPAGASGTARGPDGKFLPAGTVAAATTETVAAEPIEAPQHWPAADRELFKQATPEQQKWLLGRHKAMEADYTRRVQETTSLKRRQEQLDEIMAPYKQRLQLHGLDETGFIRYLTGMNDFFEKDFAGAVKYLAQQRNFDLTALLQTEAQVSPEVRRLENMVRDLQTQMSTGQQSQQQAQVNTLVSQIDQFAQAKDANGQPTHPHFDAVAKDMTLMVRAMRADGQEVTAHELQDIYERAVYANPEVRQQVLAAERQAEQTKAEAERKRKAEEAKRAGFDVRGTGGVATAPSGNSVRGDLEAAFAAHGAS